MSKAVEKAGQRERTIPPMVSYDQPKPPAVPRAAEEYDAWFRARVQEALDDPRPGLPHEQVMAEVRALIESKPVPLLSAGLPPR